MMRSGSSAATASSEGPSPAISRGSTPAAPARSAIAGDGPSLEAVAALEPDLIIGPLYLVEPVYRQLSRIAPTLALPTNQEEPWQDTLRRLGRELGRSDEAAEAIAAYESRRDEIRRRHADAIATARVSIFSAFPGEVALSGRTQLIVQTLYDLGGRVPPGHPGLAGDFRELSREQLGLLDGDVLVRRTEESDRAEVVAELESNPIYARLPAVRAGRVVDIESLTANIGSVYSALDCLDVLDRAYGLVA
jgi:iron complex transport system substrate-binding protein